MAGAQTRQVYLIRHGRPEFPDGRHMCLGRTDLPLSTVGKLQAALLGFELGGKVRYVYSSPLSRAVGTAKALGGPVRTLDGFTEQYAGEWDGLTFDEIRERYAGLYARRAHDKSIPMPGAEPDSEALARFAAAMDEALSQSDGSIAVTAHASVIQLWLRSLGTDPGKPPYGSYAVLRVSGNILSPVAVNILPRPELTDGRCLTLLRAAGLPEAVINHCSAVAARATELACDLDMDVRLVRQAAYLHDIARLNRDHALVGASWLEELGYTGLADIVRLHHDHGGEKLDEAAVVYIADKLVQGSRPVTLAERFAASESKCTTPEARTNHDLRRRSAENIARLLQERGITV